LYDALKATDGDILQVTNAEAELAMQIFSDTEGVDIHPAAAVAVASLIKEVQAGRIEQDATIMLNITGGGEARYKADKDIFHLKPNYIFPLAAKEQDVVAKVEALFG
jgi:cysteate synthase